MTKKETPMTTDALARIQSNEAKQNGGSVDSHGFAARAARAVNPNQQGEKYYGST